MKKLVVIYLTAFLLLLSIATAKETNVQNDTCGVNSEENISETKVTNEYNTEAEKSLIGSDTLPVYNKNKFESILAQNQTDNQSRENGRSDRRNRMQEMIAWRYVEYLDLTEEQSAKFFPILNEFNRKRFEIMHQRQELFNTIIKEVEDESIASRDLRTKLDELESLIGAEVKAVLGFYEKTEKFLDERQSIKLHIFEEKLKNDLFREFRDRDRRSRD